MLTEFPQSDKLAECSGGGGGSAAGGSTQARGLVSRRAAAVRLGDGIMDQEVFAALVKDVPKEECGAKSKMFELFPGVPQFA